MVLYPHGRACFWVSYSLLVLNSTHRPARTTDNQHRLARYAVCLYGLSPILAHVSAIMDKRTVRCACRKNAIRILRADDTGATGQQDSS
jgi:hypothetical protein